jgi:nicotinate phosphoribosyltransferase
MASLQLTKAEKQYLTVTCPYLSPVYLDFLEGYRYNPQEVVIKQKSGEVSITVEGYWYRTILWEVAILSLVSEVFYHLQNMTRVSDSEVTDIAIEKIKRYKNLGVTIADFGTRRRHSYQVHSLVINALKQNGDQCFTGTSNVHLALLHKTKPIGTHAHEWFMFHAAKYGFKMANLLALEHWVDVYRGDLGIALSDTYTSDVFFHQFDKKFAKLFDGVRHDSGDPLEFTEKTISHYNKFGINPLSKTIIFSDALNYKKVERITNYCKGRIGFSFGIGTNFTNDAGVKPLNIVMKLVEVCPEGEQWTPAVKLSDEKGKYTGDAKMISLAKEILNIEE